MKIGERIKMLRKEKGLQQAQLAEQIGESKQNLYKYENGIITNIPSNKIERIAEALNTTPQYIMGWDKIPSNIIPMDPNAKYIPIPVIGRVAAGENILVPNNIIDYELVEKEDILDNEDYAFLIVRGDSMEPEFQEGDLILMRIQTSVDSGSYAVVIIDDSEGVIKKVVYGKDYIELRSVNQIYPTRRFEGADMQRIYICGLVKQVRRKY